MRASEREVFQRRSGTTPFPHRKVVSTLISSWPPKPSAHAGYRFPSIAIELCPIHKQLSARVMRSGRAPGAARRIGTELFSRAATRPRYQVAIRGTGGGNQPCTYGSAFKSTTRARPNGQRWNQRAALCEAAPNSLGRSGCLSISSRPLAVLTPPSGDAGSAVALAAFRSSEGGARSRLAGAGSAAGSRSRYVGSHGADAPQRLTVAIRRRPDR